MLVNTYKSCLGIVGIRKLDDGSTFAVSALVRYAILYVGIIGTGDNEEEFEDLAAQVSVVDVGGVIEHQVDYEMMSYPRHKSSKGLYSREVSQETLGRV